LHTPISSKVASHPTFGLGVQSLLFGCLLDPRAALELAAGNGCRLLGFLLG